MDVSHSCVEFSLPVRLRSCDNATSCHTSTNARKRRHKQPHTQPRRAPHSSRAAHGHKQWRVRVSTPATHTHTHTNRVCARCDNRMAYILHNVNAPVINCRHSTEAHHTQNRYHHHRTIGWSAGWSVEANKRAPVFSIVHVACVLLMWSLLVARLHRCYNTLLCTVYRQVLNMHYVYEYSERREKSLYI